MVGRKVTLEDRLMVSDPVAQSAQSVELLVKLGSSRLRGELVVEMRAPEA